MGYFRGIFCWSLSSGENSKKSSKHADWVSRNWIDLFIESSWSSPCTWLPSYSGCWWGVVACDVAICWSIQLAQEICDRVSYSICNHSWGWEKYKRLCLPLINCSQVLLFGEKEKFYKLVAKSQLNHHSPCVSSETVQSTTLESSFHFSFIRKNRSRSSSHRIISWTDHTADLIAQFLGLAAAAAAYSPWMMMFRVWCWSHGGVTIKGTFIAFYQISWLFIAFYVSAPCLVECCYQFEVRKTLWFLGDKIGTGSQWGETLIEENPRPWGIVFMS